MVTTEEQTGKEVCCLDFTPDHEFLSNVIQRWNFINSIAEGYIVYWRRMKSYNVSKRVVHTTHIGPKYVSPHVPCGVSVNYRPALWTFVNEVLINRWKCACRPVLKYWLSQEHPNNRERDAYSVFYSSGGNFNEPRFTFLDLCRSERGSRTVSKLLSRNTTSFGTRKRLLQRFVFRLGENAELSAHCGFQALPHSFHTKSKATGE